METIVMENIIMETIIMETITMETIAAQITNAKSIITVQLFINTMATIIYLLFPITMETTKARLKTRNMATTTPQHITMETITVQVTAATATSQTLKVLLHHVTMETTTVQTISITMETTTVKTISITMETTTVKTISITMETTTVQTISIITMETTTFQTISITTMETTTVKTISITMETTTVQTISITMETTTVKTISITMDTTTVKTISITMETTTVKTISITMETSTAKLTCITMETTTAKVITKDMNLNHLDSLSRKKESPSNTSSPSSHDEEHTSFTGSSLHKEKAHELGRIMNLQGQNEGLHQSLLKTAVKMECLGEEFMSSQKLLEAELQRTRIELSNLTERFRRLDDNCSATQQTNSLLEQKLHSVAQSLEGERGRLNQRISALTEQLVDAKFANSVETSSVTSVTHNTDLHFQSDDAINQKVPHIAPPPAQFMDGHNNYETAIAGGQEQSLGPVPEEEESDWSEKGDETPQFILTGSNRGPVWRHREADVDKDSESGGEDIVGGHAPCPQQIPHLQVTIHNKNLSDGMTGEGTYRITTSQNLGSAILIRSASLEEIPLARHHMQKELRGTEAMMDLHHQGHEGMEDLDNEIIHHWRSSNDRPIESRTSEANSSLAGLESAERMLSQFICGSQAGEGQRHGRAEVHSRTGGIPDELLKGERTKL
ncbi:hypothetical protein VZT92_006025 [Zoarces viviparus]|uniref:Uncharacterized protein n=1 Tax=Zoarces viviparus TaxID=48416 RepID=A0AAW1FN26_ZOAVI